MGIDTERRIASEVEQRIMDRASSRSSWLADNWKVLTAIAGLFLGTNGGQALLQESRIEAAQVPGTQRAIDSLSRVIDAQSSQLAACWGERRACEDLLEACRP